jgi:hypothetical protein
MRSATVGDNGHLEALSQHIATLSEKNDRHRLLIGALLARADKRYGAGTVSAVASNTGLSKQSLYEYQKVERKFRGRKMSAARILREMPNLNYSHLRSAMRFPDLETRYLELVEASETGQKADVFSVTVAKKLGKPVPPAPLFDQRGEWYQVANLMQREMQRNPTGRVRVKVWAEE